MEEGNFATLPLLPQLKTKRKQVGRACANCRKSKTACSETRPCSRCVSHNVPDQCVDAPRKRRTKISAESDLNLVRVPKPRRTKQNKSPTQVKNELMDVDMMQGNKDDKDILMESCEKIQHFEFQQHLQQLQQQQQEKLEKLEKLEKQENISNNKFRRRQGWEIQQCCLIFLISQTRLISCKKITTITIITITITTMRANLLAQLAHLAIFWRIEITLHWRV